MISFLWQPILIAGLSLNSITGLVDAEKIAAHADSVGVPREVAWALAWKESRSGARGNAPRGPGKLIVDSVTPGYRHCWSMAGGKRSCWYEPHVWTHRACYEIGRFQLSPCHDYTKIDPRCTLKALRASLDDNIHCGLVWYREKVRTLCNGDLACGIERYNGRGPKARQYREEALAYIGRVTLLLRNNGYDLGSHRPPLAGSDQRGT